MPLVSDGMLFGSLNERQKENVLQLVGKLAAERFKDYQEAVEGAFDFREPKTQFEKLALYRGRGMDEWDSIRGQNPDDYKKQLDEWTRMERFNSFMRLHPRQSASASSGLQTSKRENVV